MVFFNKLLSSFDQRSYSQAVSESNYTDMKQIDLVKVNVVEVRPDNDKVKRGKRCIWNNAYQMP